MNKALLLLVVVVFIAVGALIINVGGDDESPPVARMDTVPDTSSTSVELTAAEKDTYVNTIQTISAKYRNLEEKFETLLKNQAVVEKDMPTDTEISQTVGSSVTESAVKLRRDFRDELTNLRAEVEKKFTQRSSKNSSGIPGGLGFDDLPNPSGVTRAPKMMTAWSTVMPIGSEPTMGKDGKTGSGVLNWYTDKLKGKAPVQKKTQPVAASSRKPNRKRKGDPKDLIVPAYTIPRNATLFDNNTMTALLGVIPVEGSILDPIRFKLITGKTNMASNGLFIPGVRNIVWSGIAIGNREMSCVRGELHSVTFTFDDGTIRTISTSKSTSATKTAGSKRILGYISDRQGSPCLKGTLITNASDYLKDRMIASGIAATADAYSSTQKTTTIENGVVQSFFSGDEGEFIAGKALSGSLSELSQYMRERARNAVDIVFLQAGQEVVLHVEESIDIDYDPNGRKLAYANPLSSLPASYRLD
ncbi:MAG: TIGR03752 family integrating conjugative element protein [Gammaproteobacteria bacterium]|nr:TIGR03752 family integrating conjugative element protein [Gammaproteobacteria bacterium]